MPAQGTRILKTERDTGARPAEPPAAPTAQPGEFDGRLAALMGQGSASVLQAGRISVIGLDRAREKFGDSWERLCSRVDRIARNAIERYLLPGDIYTVWQETSYLIVFASLDLERARMKCLLIADEVMKALFGEAGSDIVSVSSAVTRVEPSADGSAQSLLEQFSAPEAPAVAKASDPATPMPVAAGASVKAGLEGVHFAYRPMWDTTMGVLSAYFCVPIVRPPDGHVPLAEAAAHSSAWQDLAHLDFAVQEHVQATLLRMQAEGWRALIVLAVHFDTLAAAARRRRYIETLAKSISGEMAKLLVIEIVDVPDGAPPSRVYDLAAALRPYCRGVSARVRIECTDLGAFTGAHVHAVGCDVGALQGSELNVMQLLGRFSRAAEKAGVASFVHGLRSVSLTGAAVGAGFRYIDGEGVAKLVQYPERVSYFNLGNVYRSLLESPAGSDAEPETPR
jgi:hypothetical protein